MKKSFEEEYEKDLNNPLNLSKCEKLNVKKQVKGFFLKKMLPKLQNIEEIQNEISYEWDELLEKLLNSKRDIGNDTIENVMKIALSQKIIEEQLEEINKTSENF